jgi:(2Fe-2S) ferredoxin
MAVMTIEKLNEIKNKFAKNIELRKVYHDKANVGKRQVLVCASTGCISNKSMEVLKRFEQQVNQHGLTNKVDVVQTGCHGLCEMGPVVIVYPEGAFYAKVKSEDVDKIVENHLKNGQIVTDKL